MECREKGNKFKNATCEVHFPYKGSMMKGLAMQVVEFSNGGYKIRKIFA